MVDAFNRMGGKNKERFELFCNAIGCDGCHPTDLGYTEIAALIYKELFISDDTKSKLVKKDLKLDVFGKNDFKELT